MTRWKVRLTPSARGLSNASNLLALGSAAVAVVARFGAVAIILACLAILCAVGSQLRSRVERRTVRTWAKRLADSLSLDELLFETGRTLALGEKCPGWRMTAYRLEKSRGTWHLEACAGPTGSIPVDEELRQCPTSQGVLRVPLKSADRPQNEPGVTGVFPKPSDDMAGWRRAHVELGFSEDAIDSIKGEPLSYWGQVYSVRRRDGTHSTVGLVLESEGEKGIGRGWLEESLTRPYFEAMDTILYAKSRLEAGG